MGEYILKYNLVLLIVSNLASQFTPLGVIAPILFYTSLFLGLISNIIFAEYIRNCELRQSTPILFALIAVYTLYHFTLGVQYWNIDSWNYYLARIVTLEIVYFGVVSNYKFYFYDVAYWLSIIITVCVICGTLTDSTAAQGRFYLGFGNPNSTSAISTIGFAGYLFSKDRPKVLNILGMIICLWGVFAGGSRTMTFLCFLAMLFRFKVSFKTIGIIGFALVVVFQIIPYLGFNTIAIDRLIDVFSNGNFVGSRKDVREATMIMIGMRPLEGWGFKSGIQGGAQAISMMGSHNGYLDIIKAMGYPFAIIVFFILARYLFKIRKYFFCNESLILYHCFIVIAVLLGAMYESMLHGVNYLLNTLFYMSFSLLTYRLYFGDSYILQERMDPEAN